MKKQDIGYQKRFKFDIDMNSNGKNGDCIAWCEDNCKHRWGWWFKPDKIDYQPTNHWEHQKAFMSFENKKEAVKFWLAVGIKNMGEN